MRVQSHVQASYQPLLGARRIPYAGTWYWDLKPDYRPGEDIVL